MAYRELGVIEVREVLRRFCLGEGLRAIARGTGSDRKMVAKYVTAAVLHRTRGRPPAGGGSRDRRQEVLALPALLTPRAPGRATCGSARAGRRARGRDAHVRPTLNARTDQ